LLHVYTPQDEPDLFTDMESKYLDEHAGQWPASSAQAVIDVCEGCMQYETHSRLTVKQALTRLLAACSMSVGSMPNSAAVAAVVAAPAPAAHSPGTGGHGHAQHASGESPSTSRDVD
jgi:hypothetical protein